MLLTAHSQCNGHDAAPAWHRNAEQLAEWAWRLVNRADVWGGYRPIRDRGREYTTADGRTAVLGAVTTNPAVARRGTVLLTPAAVARHFRATAPEHVVGLHATATDNTSRWGAVDIDWHGPDSTAPALNLAAALGWYEKLVGMGFTPLLTDSNGKGGFHLLTAFREPVPTPRVFAFFRSLIADHARYGLPEPSEVFPKQPRVQPGRYGSWLRLLGRHHTRDHWSHVWDGTRWLEGEAAVALILGLRGNSPDLIPAAPPVPGPAPPPAPRRVPAAAPLPPPPSQHRDENLSARIAAYVSQLPNLAEGQGRDDVAYHFAAFLVRDLAVPDAAALDWLRHWDAGNRPPKGDEALLKVIANAHAYGRRPYGAGRASRRRVRGRHGLVGHLRFSVRI
jgi:hypothetical protein